MTWEVELPDGKSLIVHADTMEIEDGVLVFRVGWFVKDSYVHLAINGEDWSSVRHVVDTEPVEEG